MAPMTVEPLPVPWAAATSAWAWAISANARRVRRASFSASRGGSNPGDCMGDRGLTEVRRAAGRAQARAPDHLLKGHEMPDVGRRARNWARGGHVHNLLYPAVNCNYPPGRARLDNGRSRAF